MHVILCHCTNRNLLSPPSMAALRETLSRQGHTLVDVADFCAACAERSAPLMALLERPDTLICACRTRTLRALLQWVDAPAIPTGKMPDCLGLLDEPIPGETELLERYGGRETTMDSPDLRELRDGLPSRDAWYPIIDRERCIDCGKCHDFCLFGTYSRPDDQRVIVSAPDQCKINCPACARICPANAIIFPKSDDDAINGSVLDAEALATARIRLKPEELVGGNLYAKLAARRQKTKPKLFKPGAFPAVADRDDEVPDP